MKSIAVIVGHPFAGSFNHALADRYATAARAAGAEVSVIDLASVPFALSPVERDELRLREGEPIDKLGEPIAAMLRTVQSADHLAFFYPVWWGTYPAVLKGFIDRMFVSGAAYQYGSKPNDWKRLFRGKNASLHITMDAPAWFNRFQYRAASQNAMTWPFLWYVGIKVTSKTVCDAVRFSTDAKRSAWLERAARLGTAAAR